MSVRRDAVPGCGADLQKGLLREARLASKPGQSALARL
jgi:hypothetical protein